MTKHGCYICTTQAVNTQLPMVLFNYRQGMSYLFLVLELNIVNCADAQAGHVTYDKMIFLFVSFDRNVYKDRGGICTGSHKQEANYVYFMFIMYS